MNGKKGWTVEFLPEEASFDLLDLAITSNGDVFISAPHKNDSSLVCFWKNLKGDRWFMESVDPEPLSALFLDMTLINPRTPAVTYMDLDGVDLKLAVREDLNLWRKIALEVPNDVGGFPKAKPLSPNTIAITFYDYTSKTLKLGIYDRGKWSSTELLETTPPQKLDMEVIGDKIFIAFKTEIGLRFINVDLMKRKFKVTSVSKLLEDCLNFDFTPIPEKNLLAFGIQSAKGNIHIGITDPSSDKAAIYIKQLKFSRNIKFKGDLSVKVFKDSLLMSCFDGDNEDLIALRIPLFKISSPEDTLQVEPNEFFVVDSIGNVGQRNKLEIAKVEYEIPPLETPEGEQGIEEPSEPSQIQHYYAFIVYSDNTNNRVKLAKMPL